MSAILSADDLNDFITLGAACIKPPTVSKPADDSNENLEVEVQIDNDGNGLEVSKDGTTTNLSAAQISLADCLACSGCITSAEEILVAQHSHDELVKALKNNTDKLFVASVSHQARASLATAFNLKVEDIDRLLINLFINQMGFKAVVGTSLGRKLSLVNESFNIINKKEQQNSQEPILSSICPGWVLYAEKTHPFILSKLSDVKSPQQITGCLMKNLMSEQLETDKSNIYHLSIMPCFDKKLESARPEDGVEESFKDVDCVLTAKELVTLLDQQKDLFQLIPSNANKILNSPIAINELYKKVAPVNWPMIEDSWTSDEGSTSGGYSYNYLKILKKHLILKNNLLEENFELKTIYGKNSDVYEMRLMYNNEKVGSAAIINGFRNIQNLVRKFKPDNKPKGKFNPLVARRRARKGVASKSEEELADPFTCDYVEIMACPNGCINGGGQISHPTDVTEKDWLMRVVENYQNIPIFELTNSSTINDLIIWSESFSNKFQVSENRLFRTWFKEVQKPTDPNEIMLGAKW